MHILLIHQAFAALGEPGGTRHHEFARLLRQAGHRVTVLGGQISYLTGSRAGASGWVSRDVDDVGVRIWRTYTYSGWHRSFFHRILSFLSFMLSSFLVGLRVPAVDLVWGTSPPIFQGLTAWALARLKGAAFIFEVRDLWPAFAVAVGVLRQPLLIRAAEWFERFLYRHADRVVVNSPGFEAHVRERGASQVDLIPNGVDVDMFAAMPDASDYRRAHGLKGAYVVLYAGAHGMSNDLGVVLDAAELLQGQDDIHVLFVGDGKEKQALVREAARRQLQHVHFQPPVPKQEMPQVLAAADSCLAILKPLEAYKTTYPNKVFDYMAAGKPVLLAIDGVVREVVEQAQAGMFVPPGDPGALAEAIRTLAADREAGREMGRRGRAYVSEHFNRPQLAQRLAKLMQETLEGQRTPPANRGQRQGDANR